MPTDREFYASFPGGVAGLRELNVRSAVLEDPDPLPIGSRLSLTLHLGRLTVSCSAVVIRSVFGEGMAVDFAEMSATDRRHLLEYVTAARAAASRPNRSPGPSSASLAPAIPAVASATVPTQERPAPLSRFTDFLIRRGVITADQLQLAAAKHRQSGDRLCAVLLRLGFVSDEKLAACFSEAYRIPSIDLKTVNPTAGALRLLPYELAQRHEILPIGVTPSTLTVATSDPSNLEGRNDVMFRAHRNLTVAVAPSGLLREKIDYFYSVPGSASSPP